MSDFEGLTLGQLAALLWDGIEMWAEGDDREARAEQLHMDARVGGAPNDITPEQTGRYIRAALAGSDGESIHADSSSAYWNSFSKQWCLRQVELLSEEMAKNPGGVSMEQNAEDMHQLTEQLDAPSLKLVAQILNKSLQEAHATSRALHDLNEHRLKRAQAELGRVRDVIEELLSHPWMPQPDAVRKALYPSVAEIDRRMKETEEES